MWRLGVGVAEIHPVFLLPALGRLLTHMFAFVGDWMDGHIYFVLFGD
jgi:hypothetical protein